MMITEGFRTANDAYFEYVHYKKDTHQQTTPFILCKNDGTIKTITHTNILLAEAKEDDVILHTWLGQWSSDVVSFKIIELKMYRLDNNIF